MVGAVVGGAGLASCPLPGANVLFEALGPFVKAQQVGKGTTSRILGFISIDPAGAGL